MRGPEQAPPRLTARRAGLAFAGAAALLALSAAPSQAQLAAPPRAHMAEEDATPRQGTLPTRSDEKTEQSGAVPVLVSAPRSGGPGVPLTALACLASLISCAVSAALWMRVEASQQAAQAALQAAGKLLDSAARRFAHHQDEAGGAMQEATAAAGQAGQAASRLATASRETEARLSACVAEAQARLQALAQHQEDAASELGVRIARVVETISAAGAPAIEDAIAALRQNAQDASARLIAQLHTLPELLARALMVADARGVGAMTAATRNLEARADAVARDGPTLMDAAEALVGAQDRQQAMTARVEALAGVLPAIAISLASTAAAQRQLVSQASTAMDASAQRLAKATTANLDETASFMRQLAQLAQPAAQSPPRLAREGASEQLADYGFGHADTPKRARKAAPSRVAPG